MKFKNPEICDSLNSVSFEIQTLSFSYLFHLKYNDLNFSLETLVTSLYTFKTYLSYTSVSFFLSCIQGRHCHLPKFHIYVLVYCIGVFLIFKGSFSFIAKLSIKYRDVFFLYSPWPYTCITSPLSTPFTRVEHLLQFMRQYWYVLTKVHSLH